MNAYRDKLARSRSSMSHSVNTTHLTIADRTVVNTMAEIALPGFLMVDHATSVLLGERFNVRFIAPFLHVF